MDLNNFDIKKISQMLTSQLKCFFPKDLNDDDKDYIVNIVEEYCLYYAEKLQNSIEEVNKDQATTIIQIIREWALNRTIEMVESDVKKPIIDETLKIILEKVYGQAKSDQLRGVTIQNTLDNLDYSLYRDYLETVINKSSDKSVLFFDPGKLYARLGVDILQIHLGVGLIEIADSKENGDLLAEIRGLRKNLTDEYGYVIPNIRLLDSASLDENEFSIYVRNREVLRGTCYPDKIMVNKNDWNNAEMPVPDDTIFDVDPISKDLIYWINIEEIEKNYNKITVSPAKYIIKNLEECVLRHVDSIITISDTLKVVEISKSYNPYYANTLIPSLITASDLRNIYVNLIIEKVKLQDIVLVFERLCDYARFNAKPDVLSEQLRKVLAWSICKDSTDRQKVVTAIDLSHEWTEILRQNHKEIDNRHVIELDKTIQADFIKKVSLKLKEIYSDLNIRPVIICCPEIRLALYRLLKDEIPYVKVIASNELVKDIKINLVGSI